MKKLLVKLRLGSFLLCALLSACVSIERSYPDKHYFVLDVSQDSRPSSQTASGVLEVAEMRISPRYQDQSFVYRISEAGYESDFYNQFLIAPAALVTEATRQALARAGIFEHVISPSTQLSSTYRLEGLVDALYGDFRNAAAGRAVLEMEFFLSKSTPAGPEIVMDKHYANSVQLAGRSPEALVKGWDEALKAILDSLVADLKAAKL